MRRLLVGFFANDVSLTARAPIDWQSIDDARPGLAACVRAIVVLLRRLRSSRPATATAEAEVGEYVGRIDVAVSGFHGNEVGSRRQIGEIRDVVPRLAAVHRVVDLSRGAARPDDALLDGREREIGARPAQAT